MNVSEATETSFNLFESVGVTPWIVLLIAAVPLVFMILVARVYPTQRVILAAILPLSAFAGLPFISTIFPVAAWGWSILVMVLAVTVALLLLADMGTLFLTSRHLVADRKLARVGSLGNPHITDLSIENRSWRDLRIEVSEDVLEGLTVSTPSETVVSPKNKRTKVQFALTPHRRGAFQLERIYFRVFSFLGFWHHQSSQECKSDLYVYPDIKQIGKYALLARTNRLTQIGVRRTRRIGQDNDFERLRDYQQDDNYKHIDWRTSARRQKLTVKQFQTDQSQRVIFMLDCGRMMTNEYERLSLLDYALNSILMLSYVALDQGDSVGMICFSDKVHKFVPPAGGRKQMNRILHAGFNQFPRLVQSRFDDAFLYLSHHCRKRSLVVLVTNVIDEVNSQQIQNYMQNLIGCHLPLLVLLRDHRIFDAADNPAPDPAVLYRSAAACQLLLWRDQVIRQMRASGGLALDVFPNEMTSPLVNQYLEVKARHML